MIIIVTFFFESSGDDYDGVFGLLMSLESAGWKANLLRHRGPQI